MDILKVTGKVLLIPLWFIIRDVFQNSGTIGFILMMIMDVALG